MEITPVSSEKQPVKAHSDVERIIADREAKKAVSERAHRDYPDFDIAKAAAIERDCLESNKLWAGIARDLHLCSTFAEMGETFANIRDEPGVRHCTTGLAASTEKICAGLVALAQLERPKG